MTMSVDFQLAYRVLVGEISKAKCWHDIEIAIDALFHARLIWDGMERERKLFDGQGSVCAGVQSEASPVLAQGNGMAESAGP